MVAFRVLNSAKHVKTGHLVTSGNFQTEFLLQPVSSIQSLPSSSSSDFIPSKSSKSYVPAAVIRSSTVQLLSSAAWLYSTKLNDKTHDSFNWSSRKSRTKLHRLYSTFLILGRCAHGWKIS